MRLRFTIRDLLWLTLAGFLIMPPAECFAQENAERKPVVSFWGSHSRIDKPNYQLVTSEKDWTDLWLRHTGNVAVKEKEYDYFYNPAGVPNVNFDKFMVIAVFSGKSQNCAGIQAITLTESADRTTFRFREKLYQTGPNADDATPYGLFVVSRSTKPVVLEEDVQHLKNEAPAWKEVARFSKR